MRPVALTLLFLTLSGCLVDRGRVRYTSFPTRQLAETRLFHYSELVHPPEDEWGSPIAPDGSLAIIPALAIDLVMFPFKLVYGAATTPMARPAKRDPLEFVSR